MTELRTRRLVIRPKSPADFEGVHAMASDYEVVRWTSSWPWPADPGYTRDRLGWPQPQAGIDATILDGGTVAGNVHIARGTLGYMLPRAAWGRGIASEACAALLNWAFALGHETIEAGVFDGNDASVRVLTKLGFRQTGRSTAMCRAQGRELAGADFALSRAAWAAQRPIEFPGKPA